MSGNASGNARLNCADAPLCCSLISGRHCRYSTRLMCTLAPCRSIGRRTYRPTVDRRVSTDCRSTRSQPTVGRQSADCRPVGFRQKSLKNTRVPKMRRKWFEFCQLFCHYFAWVKFNAVFVTPGLWLRTVLRRNKWRRTRMPKSLPRSVGTSMPTRFACRSARRRRNTRTPGTRSSRKVWSSTRKRRPGKQLVDRPSVKKAQRSLPEVRHSLDPWLGI